MHFTTKIPIQKNNYPIDYSSKIVLFGSCFASTMGEKFKYFKFQTTLNPFGIIFNSVSLKKIIERSATILNTKINTDAAFEIACVAARSELVSKPWGQYRIFRAII